MVRPSPFSAQKTFERHNSRRKSNISFCSNINLAAATGSRRGSGMTLNNLGGPQPSYPSSRAPPLVTTKSNSLSLPDSPTVAGQVRGRSNSLRVSCSFICCRLHEMLTLSVLLLKSMDCFRLITMYCYDVPIHFDRVYRTLEIILGAASHH